MENEVYKWKFSHIPAIEESTFNNSLEKFYDLGIDGLVRENLQNSSDAKLITSDKPVKIKIEIGKINEEKIPGICEIKERIKNLIGHNEYTKETIEHMKSKMNEREVSYISFEDINTKGLKGAKNGQSDLKSDTWSIYAYSKGVHSNDEDESFEQSRGGSHGIGKIASNAASDLHIMLFANCDEEGNQHLGGTVQLIEHKFNNECYRSTGYFTDRDNGTERFIPYANDFDEVFAKRTRGLKIIVPYLREQFNNEDEIIKCVCSSFFVAILENKLEVEVNDKVINSETIEEYINNQLYYEQNMSEIKKDFTPIYYKTYTEIKPRKVQIPSKENEYEFNLYFKYDDNITSGRVGIIRTLGMKIEDKKVKGNVNKPYNAILIPSSSKEDMFLKTLENESHTALSFEHIKDLKLQKSAKRFINNLDKKIAEILAEEIRSHNPTDGIMDTKDILYTIENKFKREIIKNTSTVKVNDISGKGKTEIVKISSEMGSFELEDEGDKVAGGKNESDSNKKRSKSKTKRKKRQPKKINRNINVEENIDDTEGYNEKSEKSKYVTYPDTVDRIILGEREVIKFDFSQSDELKNAKKCDVLFSIIDGMGNEYNDEFVVNENYEYAIDRSNGERCRLKNDRIENLSINNGIVQIELKTNSNYNKALKFVYYVEA